MAVLETRTTTLSDDANGDGKVSPGDTLLTEILVKNATATPLTNLTINDSLTSGTTYVAGSTVVTIGDAYSLTGNTPKTISTAQGLLANDYHFDGINAGTNTGLVVTQINGTAIGGAITVFDAANNALTAGTVIGGADGSFTFTPATGYTGTAAFTYADSDGSGTIGHGTVNLAVTGLVWYVDSAASAAGADGSYLHPFTTLASVSSVDHVNDTIVLHGTVAGGITLKGGETFYGDGSTFSVNNHQITNAGSDSVINHAAAGIVVASGNTIDGIDLVGTAATATGITDNGGAVGTLTINHMAISGQGQIFDVDTSGVLAVNLTSAASTTFTTASQGGAIDLQNVTGAFTVAGGTTIGGTQSSNGIDVNGGAGFVATFTGATSVNTGAANAITVAAGTAAFTGAATVTTTSGAGVTMSGGAASFNGGATISATTGAGLVTTGGTLNIASGTISTSTGHIVDMANTTVGTVALSSLTSSGAVTGSAINFNNVDGGTFGATTVTVVGATVDGIAITGGSNTAITFGNTAIGTGGTAVGSHGISVTNNAGTNVTFNGTVSVITSSASAVGVNLDTDTGTIAFSGGTKTITTTGGDAIHIANNGALVSFTGGSLGLSSTTGDAIDAQGTTPSGTNALTISGNANTVSTTSGVGVRISGVQTDVTLQSVKVSAATTDGIYINNGGTTAASHFVIQGTGTAANNTLTGTGAAATDGSALNGIGVYLNSIAGVDISKLTIAGDWNNFGIRGDNVFGFQLHDSTLSGTYGDSNAAEEAAVRFGSQTGTSGIIGTGVLEGNTIGGGWEDNLDLYLWGANTANYTIRDNATSGSQAIFNVTQNPGTSGSGNDNILVESGGTSTLTLNLDGLDVRGAHGDLLQIVANDDTTQHITVANSMFNNNFSAATSANTIGGGVYIGGGGDGATYNVDFNVHDNTFKGAKDTAIAFIYGGDSQTVAGTFANNTIGTASGGGSTLSDGSGSQFGNGLEVDSIHQAGSGQSRVGVTILNNQIHDWSNLAGIALYATGNSGSTGSEILQATITGSTVNEGTAAGSSSLAALYAFVGSKNGTDNGTIGLNLNGNTLNAPGSAVATIDLDQLSNNSVAHYDIPGYTVNANTSHGEFRGSGGTASTSLESFWGGTNTIGTVTSPIIGAGRVYAGSTIGITNSAFVAIVPLQITAPSPADGSNPTTPSGDKGIGASGPSVDIGVTGPTIGIGTGGDGGTTGGGIAMPPPGSVSSITHNLTQAELDQMVGAAIHRWELAGATAEQIATMKAVTVSVSDIAGLGVGDSMPGHILVSSSGAGYGWFIDATPGDDNEFTGTGSDLTAADGSAAAGHIDLLTVVEHELGHQIGLSDLYSPFASADLMYGYINPSERRLPITADVHAASGAPIDHEAFALAPVTIASLAANTSVDVSFRSTVNAYTPGLVPTLAGSSSITWQGNATPITASETTNTTNTLRTDGASNVTAAALAQASLTLGNLVYKDNDKSGTFNAGDTGIGNVTVKLYIDTNSNGVYDAGTDVFVAQTTTSNVAGTLGQYGFIGLAPGDYVAVIPASNFGGGVLGTLVPHIGALDPDNNVDNDNNGIAVAGGDVASRAITLAFDTETTAGPGNDTNNTVDFGFQTNAAPTPISDVVANTNEDTPITYSASSFTGNDSDPDGDTFSITGVSNGSHGTAVLNGNGTITYTPDANYNGSDNFQYTITDSHGATGTANAFLTIDPVNDAPTGTDATFSARHGTLHTLTAAEFGFSDIENNAFVSVTITTKATAGRLVFANGDGTFTAVTAGQLVTIADINAGKLLYKATPGVNDAFTGSFTFQVHDDGGTAKGGFDTDQSPNTLTFTVPPNVAPSGANSTIAVTHGVQHALVQSDFGFSDPDGYAFAGVTIDSLPTVGRLLYAAPGQAAVPVTVNQFVSAADIAEGRLVYKPRPGSGDPATGSFTFQVHDDGGTGNGGVDTDPTPNTLTFDPGSSQLPLSSTILAPLQHDAAGVIQPVLDSESVFDGSDLFASYGADSGFYFGRSGVNVSHALQLQLSVGSHVSAVSYLDLSGAGLNERAGFLAEIPFNHGLQSHLGFAVDSAIADAVSWGASFETYELAHASSLGGDHLYL